MWQTWFYTQVNQRFRRKQPISHIKRTTRTRFCWGSLFGVWGFPIDIFVNCYIEIPQHHIVWWNYPLTKGKTIFVRVFLFRHPFTTNSTIFWTLLRSKQYNFFSTFCDFLSGKSRDIVHQRTFWFTWLIFVQHGLFGILLTVHSALSCLTDHGIYYITRCRIWLLTKFQIPYIRFQREVRKVTPPKLYLSFLFSIYVLSQYCYLWDHLLYLLFCKFNLDQRVSVDGSWRYGNNNTHNKKCFHIFVIDILWLNE